MSTGFCLPFPKKFPDLGLLSCCPRLVLSSLSAKILGFRPTFLPPWFGFVCLFCKNSWIWAYFPAVPDWFCLPFLQEFLDLGLLSCRSGLVLSAFSVRIPGFRPTFLPFWLVLSALSDGIPGFRPTFLPGNPAHYNHNQQNYQPHQSDELTEQTCTVKQLDKPTK